MDMGGGESESDEGFDMGDLTSDEGEGEAEGGEEETGPTLMARYLHSIRPGNKK